jgi:hypothetical protein
VLSGGRKVYCMEVISNSNQSGTASDLARQNEEHSDNQD